MMKKFLVLGIFIFLTGFCRAQVQYLNQVDLEMKDGFYIHISFTFGENGFLVGYENMSANQKQRTCYYDLYDSNLVLKNTFKTDVEVNHEVMLAKCYKSKVLHELFADPNNRFVLVTLDVSTGEITKATGMFPKTFQLNDMQVLDDFIYISGAMNDNQVVEVLNWRTGKTELIPIEIPGVKPRKVSYASMKALEESKEVFVMLSVRPDNKTTDMYSLHLTDNGKMKELINITAGSDAHFFSATVNKLDANTYVVMGTYAAQSDSKSEGIFISRMSKGKTDVMDFYPFSDIKDFMKYRSAKKHSRLDVQTELYMKQFKESDWNDMMYLHNPIQQADGLVFIGECFYPTYKNEIIEQKTHMNGNIPVTTNSSIPVFSGYDYTHALIIKIDSKGKMVWLNSVGLDVTKKPVTQEEVMEVYIPASDKIYLLYSESDSIYTNTINTRSNVIDRAEEKINVKTTSEEVVKGTEIWVRHWYNNYYLSVGSKKFDYRENNKINAEPKLYHVSKLKFVL